MATENRLDDGSIHLGVFPFLYGVFIMTTTLLYHVFPENKLHDSYFVYSEFQHNLII